MRSSTCSSVEFPSRSNGCAPVNIIYKMIPSENISMGGEMGSFLDSSSGGQ